MLNEATANTTENYTIDAGTVAFTSAGNLYMPAVNDQITFVMPWYEKNLASFPVAEAVMSGGTLTRYDLFYAIDKNNGSGYSAWKNLSYPRAGAGGSNGAYTVTMTDTTGVAANDYVFGTNVAYGAKVQSVDNGTTVTVTLPNIGTVSGVLRFSQLPNEGSVSETNGVKLKVRVKTNTSNTDAITAIYFYVTPGTGTNTQPLDLVPVVLTGLKNPSEVRIFSAGTTTEIAGTGQESVTTGIYTGYLDASVYSSVDISILSLGYQNTRLLSVSVPSTGVTIPVQQVLDRQYANV
jgi:hypothetical protein